MTPRCRNCAAALDAVFCDLGMQPIANGLLGPGEVDGPQTYYPLKPLVCRNCLLVQLPSVVAREESFNGSYPYFSGQSADWVRHCEAFVMQALVRFAPWHVLELGSNDGTLLRMFAERGCGEVVGVEPSGNVAEFARTQGVATVCDFFGRRLVESELWTPRWDLIVANNVLAHVPDLDDFVGGMTNALAPEGVVTIEFPWIANLVEQAQWDTIYHEHYSYFSLLAVQRVLGRRGLRIFDVEQIATHGGSLRVYACHQGAKQLTQAAVAHLLRDEGARRLHSLDTYEDFQAVPPAERKVALDVLADSPLRTAGYGAPAKGMTFLNYCGLGPETIEFLVDSTPAKQGKFTPGSRIPVLAPDALTKAIGRVLVLPWNWAEEIRAKIAKDCRWKPEILARPFA